MGSYRPRLGRFEYTYDIIPISIHGLHGPRLYARYKFSNSILFQFTGSRGPRLYCTMNHQNCIGISIHGVKRTPILRRSWASIPSAFQFTESYRLRFLLSHYTDVPTISIHAGHYTAQFWFRNFRKWIPDFNLWKSHRPRSTDGKSHINGHISISMVPRVQIIPDPSSFRPLAISIHGVIRTQIMHSLISSFCM